MTFNGVIRIVVLVWACGLITWSDWFILTRTPRIDDASATALAAITGILAIAVSLYEWQARKETA